jgi:hypothetical protein
MTVRRPIFIVGCPRSGTTLLRLILDSHPNISCGPESHFLTDMEGIVGRYWHRITPFGFAKTYWHEKIAEFFDSFQMEHARARGKSRWADKTPKYSIKLAFINDVFPDAQVVHVIRDPYDVVASHRERWGYKSALECANRTWREYITSARSVGTTLPPERYREVRYEELVAKPEAVVRSLIEYLGEPWTETILDYQKFDHNMAGQKHAKLTEQRRQSAGESSTIYQSRVGAGKRELDPFLKFALRRKSAGLMKELGY